MYLSEYSVDNYLYMLEIENIINNPQMLNENILDDMKSWTSGKFQSFATAMTQAAKSKDTNRLKSLSSALPSMSLSDIEDIGKKTSKNFISLKSKAVKVLKKKSKNKLSGQKLEASALAFATRSLIDKNPDQKMDQMLDDLDEMEDEAIDVTVGDVLVWITAALLGVATTFAVAYLTGVLFIFGPLIFFALWKAILTVIFGKG